MHSWPSWHSELLQLMPSSHHLLRSCTNASLRPPSLPKSKTLTQQPSKFMSGCYPFQHLQITGWLTLQISCTPVCQSASCHVWYPSQDLGPCYCGTCPTQGELPGTHQWWYCLPPHKVTPGWMQCQTCWHCSRCHNNHTAGSCQTSCLCARASTNQTCTTSTTLTCCTHNTYNSKATGHSCSHHTSSAKGCPCTYTCNTQCSPHAAQKIRSCSCSIQVPDTGDVTVLLPMRGDPWPRMSPDFIT